MKTLNNFKKGVKYFALIFLLISSIYSLINLYTPQNITLNKDKKNPELKITKENRLESIFKNLNFKNNYNFNLQTKD